MILRSGDRKKYDMKKYAFILGFIICLLAQLTASAQTYKAGDNIEVFINNTWKKATVVKPIPGKQGVYEIKETVSGNRGASLIRTVTSDKLRMPKQASAVSTAAVNTMTVENKTNGLRLGRYELYAGVPSIYLGHMILQENGKYKVAFNTDEDNYDEMGRYVFHAETNTIEWQFGIFRNNNWGGKVVTKENGSIRIEFTPTSYAEIK